MRRILGTQPDHFRFHGPVEDLAVPAARVSMRFGIKGFRIEKKSVVVINNVGNAAAEHSMSQCKTGLRSYAFMIPTKIS